MTRLDKCIKLNFQMVGNDIGIMCVMAGTVLICVLGIITLVLSPVLAVIQVIFAVKMYKNFFIQAFTGRPPLFISQSLQLQRKWLQAKFSRPAQAF